MESEPDHYEPYQYTIEQLEDQLDRVRADLDHLDDTESIVHMRQDILREQEEGLIHQIEIMKGDYGAGPNPEL